MKKRVVSILMAAAMVVGLAACGGQATGSQGAAAPAEETASTAEAAAESAAEPAAESAAEEASSEKEVPETAKVRWNYGTSGNVLVTLAIEKGYFDEYGITIEPVEATAVNDAMALLSTGMVDVVSNSGTSNPLQQISSGVDMTIFGGHMVTGAMPVVAKKGTEWKDVTSLVGKKFACNPSYFAYSGALMEAGVDNPLEAVEWVTYDNYNDALAAVQRGEVDFANLGTGLNQQVKKMEDIEIVSYQSEIMPNYSCCRMECSTEFLNNNPITLKLICKALLRAQAYYESNKEESCELLAKTIGADYDYVAAYMMDEKHYVVNVDPLKNSIIRAWGILDKIGFLKDKAKEINIEDHINTEIYEQALAEVTEEYPENAEFWAKQAAFFEENDK